jgi:transaldolase
MATSTTRRWTTGHSVWCGIPGLPEGATIEVEAYLREHGVSGLVWQAQLFARAVERGDHDEDIRAGLGRGAESKAWELLAADAQRACGMLSALARDSDGDEGIVSVPLVRLSVQESWTDAAQRLASAIGRPNLAFAFPADDEGIAAVTELIAVGYRTDVLGAVSCDQVRRADEAYAEGLARRLEQGLPLATVSSTVEMPIAVIDDAANARLDAFAADEDPLPPDESEIDKPWPGEARLLRGEVAVAHAKACQAEHEERVASEPFARLVAMGARPQRLRFAMLTNNDPPTLYAGRLLGHGVVLTVTPDALEALATLEAAGPEADALASAGEVLARFADIHQDLGAVLRDAFETAVAQQGEAWSGAVRAVEERHAALGATGRE